MIRPSLELTKFPVTDESSISAGMSEVSEGTLPKVLNPEHLCLENYLPDGLRSKIAYDELFTPVMGYRVLPGDEGFDFLLPDELDDLILIDATRSVAIVRPHERQARLIDLNEGCAVDLNANFALPEIAVADRRFLVYDIEQSMTLIWRHDSLLPESSSGHRFRYGFNSAGHLLQVNDVFRSANPNHILPMYATSSDFQLPGMRLIREGRKLMTPAGPQILNEGIQNALIESFRGVMDDLNYRLSRPSEELTSFLPPSGASWLTADQLSILSLTWKLLECNWVNTWQMIVDVNVADRTPQGLINYFSGAKLMIQRQTLEDFRRLTEEVYQKLKSMYFRTYAQDEALGILNDINDGRFKEAWDEIMSLPINEDKFSALIKYFEDIVFDRRRCLRSVVRAIITGSVEE